MGIRIDVHHHLLTPSYLDAFRLMSRARLLFTAPRAAWANGTFKRRQKAQSLLRLLMLLMNMRFCDRLRVSHQGGKADGCHDGDTTR